MKIVLSRKGVEHAPKSHARVKFVADLNTPHRIVLENGVITLEMRMSNVTDLTARALRTLCRSVICVAKEHRLSQLAINFEHLWSKYKHLPDLSPESFYQLAVENFEMANFEFNEFKTPPKEGWGYIDEIVICDDASVVRTAAVKKGQTIGQAVNACRMLANTPGGDMTPEKLARAARDAAKNLPISVTVLGEKEMKKIGMGAILGVAKGSTEPPTFTVMDYTGKGGAPIVLIGKGVTFDSGGLNLKPSGSIYEMHMDMSGAAAALYTVVLAAQLKLKQRVIALLPSVENMPGNSAYRPGDVLRSLSGKTIEVLDTDAEGRLILADALTYAKRLKPALVIDIATLTGAVISALGLHASGLFSRDDAFAEKLLASAEHSGDYAWRLPLWDEYEDRVKGDFADIKNVPGGSTSRYGGAIDGAMFLWQFAKELDCPWAHIDIASRMTAAPGDKLAKGAAGEPVRLLIHFIEHAVHDKN